MLYLRELHLHVGKDMEESHNRVPQTTVSQTLLVSSTRSLDEHSDNVGCIILNIYNSYKVKFQTNMRVKRQKVDISMPTDLYVLSECVEDLFGHFNGLREVLLAMCINHILP